MPKQPSNTITPITFWLFLPSLVLSAVILVLQDREGWISLYPNTPSFYMWKRNRRVPVSVTIFVAYNQLPRWLNAQLIFQTPSYLWVWSGTCSQPFITVRSPGLLVISPKTTHSRIVDVLSAGAYTHPIITTYTLPWYDSVVWVACQLQLRCYMIMQYVRLSVHSRVRAIRI